MADWNKAIVTLDASIRMAMLAIEKSSIQAAIIVDENLRLVGLATDGDIRRGFLSGYTLEDSIIHVMNPKPMTFPADAILTDVKAIMQEKDIYHLPIVDSEERIVDFIFLDNIKSNIHNNVVVLMAGGLGSRLRPLTDVCPKPLLKVAGKSISEILLEEFIKHGFKNFYFSVNYRAEMIKSHFEDGAQWGVKIHYLGEEKRLGTAGPLSLLPKTLNEPLVVANADILTRLDFSQLLAFHTKSKAVITICVRNYQHRVPYGVIKMEDNRFVRIEEKPMQDFYVSAGVYILNPDVLGHIPFNEYCDMPDLITDLSNAGIPISVFPISEYWLDIGRIEDLEKARDEYVNS